MAAVFQENTYHKQTMDNQLKDEDNDINGKHNYLLPVDTAKIEMILKTGTICSKIALVPFG